MTREEATKTLTELWGVDYRYCLGTMGVEAVDMAIEALKEPERKKGIWIDTRDQCGEFLCSNCRETNINNFYKYCPYCGAEMETER